MLWIFLTVHCQKAFRMTVYFTISTPWSYSQNSKDSTIVSLFASSLRISPPLPSFPINAKLHLCTEFPVSTPLKEQLRVCGSWFEICILTQHTETLGYQPSCSIIQNVPQTDPWALSGRWRNVPASYIFRSTLLVKRIYVFSENKMTFFSASAPVQNDVILQWIDRNINTFCSFPGNVVCQEGQGMWFNWTL